MRSISGAIAAALVLLVFARPAINQEKKAEGAPAQPPKPAVEAAAKPAEAPVAEPETPSAPKTYIGSEVCQSCHEEIFNAFQKQPHKAVDFDKKRGWENNACESCHGPGSTHMETVSVDDIVNPAKLTAVRVDENCLTCHRNQPTQIGRIQNGHARGRVACTSCHRVHPSGEQRLVARKAHAINQQCASCHPGDWAAFQRPHAHRLPQGAMSCSDCHNPHGTFLAKQVNTFAANEPGCFSCHGNLRGPFTYEHSPMRTEGCRTCHEPHGSANPKMLTRAEVRYVCLECHANLPPPSPNAGVIGGVPPSFHDLRSPRYRNCTICHQKIHGSHVDRKLLR